MAAPHSLVSSPRFWRAIHRVSLVDRAPERAVSSSRGEGVRGPASERLAKDRGHPGRASLHLCPGEATNQVSGRAEVGVLLPVALELATVHTVRGPTVRFDDDVRPDHEEVHLVAGDHRVEL